jgi:hypothetical protein
MRCMYKQRLYRSFEGSHTVPLWLEKMIRFVMWILMQSGYVYMLAIYTPYCFYMIDGQLMFSGTPFCA